MKTGIKNFVLFLFVFVVSCSEPTDMLTVIREDGSCYRQFATYASPEFLLGDTAASLNPFPVDIDTSWHISWKYGNMELCTVFPITKSKLDSLVKAEIAKQVDTANATTNSANLPNLSANQPTSTSKSNDAGINAKIKKSDVKVSVKMKSESPMSAHLQDSIQQVVQNLEDTLRQEVDNALNVSEPKKNEFKVWVVARHDYTTVDEMAKQFRLKSKHEWSDKKIVYQLKKNFRWFYTYFTYNETYPRIQQKFDVPIDQYLTKEEADFWFTGNKSLIQGMNGIEIRELTGRIEDKYNLWFAHNSWNAEYKVVLANYHKIKHPPVSYNTLKAMSDTIFAKAKVNLENFDMKKELNNHFKTNAFSDLWEMENSPMKAFENEYNTSLLKGFGDSFNYKLVLPGKIVRPNDAVIQGDTLVWRLTSYRLIQNDFRIEAQSRKANVWAFVVSGLLLVLAIGSFVWKAKK